MEEQLKPIKQPTDSPQSEEPSLTAILPDLKNTEDVISKLPEWSIEPPLEINRGNE